MSGSITRAIIISGILSTLLVIVVVATGQTFGQRCAEVFEKGSNEWTQRVSDLKRGE